MTWVCEQMKNSMSRKVQRSVTTMLSAHGLEYDHVDSLVSENLGCCNEMAAMR